ncbi:MAG: hypothetical protein WBG62_18565, partial [Cyclobacteriaceae bacterium]
MRKLLPLLLLMAVWVNSYAQNSISANVNGGYQTAIDCKSAATVNVNFSGVYIASASGGVMIIDPDTGEEVPIITTSNSSFQVKASFGEGKVYVSNKVNTTIIDSVEINLIDLNSYVSAITSPGGNCMASDGTAQLTANVNPQAGDVTYRWVVVGGRGSTTITSGQGTPTVTVNSSSMETTKVRLIISNECIAESCNNPYRDFTLRKVFSQADKDSIQIEGITCVTDPANDVVVVAVPPVLGRRDKGQYQWNLPTSVEEEFRSADGSAIAFKVLDASQNIEVSLDLGPACNPGYTLTRTINTPPQVAQIGIASEGYVAGGTFCLSDVNTTEETFRVLNAQPGYAYNWIIPSTWQKLSATNADSTEVTLRLANNSSGNITVIADNEGCGSEVKVLNINRFSATAPAIVGTTCVAFGDTATLTYNVQGGDNTYTWEVLPANAGWVLDPNQTSLTGPSIDIIPAYGNIPTSGNVTIRATIDGNCGGGTVSSELVVNIGPDAPAAINGPDCIADPNQNITFSVDPVARAEGYEWALPSGWSSVNVGSGSSIVVNTNGTDGILTVKALGCESGIESGIVSKAVSIAPAAPGAISYYVNGDPNDGCAVKGAPQSLTFSI